MKHDLLSQLTSAASEIVPKLYPNGKRKGSEWELGSLSGEPGSSFRINLKTGLWSDFAKQGVSGNMISLFIHRNGGNVADGIKEAHEVLKLPPPIASNTYKIPKVDWEKNLNTSHPPIKYLINERRIPGSILLAGKVRSNEKEYIFVGFDEAGNRSYAQYTPLDRGEDGKKKPRFQPKYKPVLWGMHSLPNKADHSFIVITEGVIDALSFRASGVNAVSIHSGANDMGWIEHSWNFLAQFVAIYLCFDGDETGQMAAEKVASRLGFHRCKNIRLPTKDANELWCQSTEKERGDEVSLFQKYIDEAKDFEPITFSSAKVLLKRSWEFAKDGPRDQKGDFFCGWTNMRVPLRIRPGETTVYTGYAGHGKSTALLQHIAHQMFVLGKSVGLASLEIEPEESIVRIITQALGIFPEDEDMFMKVGQIISDRLQIYNSNGKASMDELTDFFEFCFRRHNCEEIVLDSLMRTNMDIQGTDKALTFEEYMKLITMTKRAGVHSHVVAHPLKGKDDQFDGIPTLYDVKGIGEIPDNADNVVCFWRNKVKQGKLEGLERSGQMEEFHRKNAEWDDSRFIILKNRFGQVTGTTGLWFDPSCYRWRTTFEKRNERYIEL